MLSNSIEVSFAQIEASNEHVFTVEFDGEHYRTVYPEPLSELNQFFTCEQEAWAQLIIDREGHCHGQMWSLHNKDRAAKLLWQLFGDTPIDEQECIEDTFLHFEKGTDRFEIWDWFENYFDVSIVEDLMMGGNA